MDIHTYILIIFKIKCLTFLIEIFKKNMLEDEKDPLKNEILS